jgi:hypothetical protein
VESSFVTPVRVAHVDNLMRIFSNILIILIVILCIHISVNYMNATSPPDTWTIRIQHTQPTPCGNYATPPWS